MIFVLRLICSVRRVVFMPFEERVRITTYGDGRALVGHGVVVEHCTGHVALLGFEAPTSCLFLQTNWLLLGWLRNV